MARRYTHVTGAEAERLAPPATRAAISLIRDAGHEVRVEYITETGSRWYYVDGSPKMTAYQMERRYWHLL